MSFYFHFFFFWLHFTINTNCVLYVFKIGSSFFFHSLFLLLISFSLCSNSYRCFILLDFFFSLLYFILIFCLLVRFFSACYEMLGYETYMCVPQPILMYYYTYIRVVVAALRTRMVMANRKQLCTTVLKLYDKYSSRRDRPMSCYRYSAVVQS